MKPYGGSALRRFWKRLERLAAKAEIRREVMA